MRPPARRAQRVPDASSEYEFRIIASPKAPEPSRAARGPRTRPGGATCPYAIDATFHTQLETEAETAAGRLLEEIDANQDGPSCVEIKFTWIDCAATYRRDTLVDFHTSGRRR